MSFRLIVLLLLCILQGLTTIAQAQITPDTLNIISDLNAVKVDKDGDGLPDFVGDTVRVGGIANISTGLLHEKFMQVFIQNDSTGFSLFSLNYDEPIHPGDSLVATGVVQEYYSLIELNVISYQVFAKERKVPQAISLEDALSNLNKYEGMLIGGEAVVIGKGNRYNGKFLNIALKSSPEKTILVYVTNFHSQYQDFDFESISIGDEVNIKGVLTQYNPNTPRENENVFKIHLRTPEDFSIVGLAKSQIIFWGTIGLVVLTIIVGWVISLQSTVNSKTKNLEQSLKEKEVLLKEIHHRVKNNLAIMSGLFELQLDNTQHEGTKKTLLDSQSRLKSMALVHDKLYSTKNLAEINMPQYIEELAQSLHKTFTSNEQDIALNLNIDDITLNIDRAIPCGLLINEIMINAFKHAFKQTRDGVITISLTEKNDAIELFIADNGDGIPESFDISESTSLGMMLIETFRQELGADLELSNNNGTSFTFTFHAV